jgi:CheY-like chemotaxis protein
MTLEHRRKKRITIVGDVVIDGNIKAKALDFSEGGMYVFIRDRFKKDDIVEVSLPFKETAIKLKAVVKHVEEGVGVGLRFFDLDNKQKTQISEFLDYFYSRPLEPGKKRVLLADSNEDSRRFDKNRLAIEGFDVFDVSNGADLMNILKGEKIDIVVTDIFLEDTDVFKVLAIIKQDPLLSKVPVLVLSSSYNTADINRAAAAGAVEVLPRITTSPCKLAERVKAILKA